MVFSSGVAKASTSPTHRQAPTQPAADERTPLLPGRAKASSSGSSSLTISSLDDSEDFVPWYATPATDGDETPVDVERGVRRDSKASKNSQDEDDVSKKAADEGKARSRFVMKIVAILVVGTFTSNADGSLVLATHPTIASEFNDLEDSSWLFTAFALAGAATQAIVSPGRGCFYLMMKYLTPSSSTPNSATSTDAAPS